MVPIPASGQIEDRSFTATVLEAEADVQITEQFSLTCQAAGQRVPRWLNEWPQCCLCVTGSNDRYLAVNLNFCNSACCRSEFRFAPLLTYVFDGRLQRRLLDRYSHEMVIQTGAETPSTRIMLKNSVVPRRLHRAARYVSLSYHAFAAS